MKLIKYIGGPYNGKTDLIEGDPPKVIRLAESISRGVTYSCQVVYERNESGEYVCTRPMDNE